MIVSDNFLKRIIMPLNGKTVLVTGGTGSFGKAFLNIAFTRYKPEKLIVFSRDELKQHELQSAMLKDGDEDTPLRFFIGDVRDRNRLNRSMKGVDIVIHAAALKQIPACEYNPFEAIQTNIIGTRNVIDAAIDRGVEKVVALSTDKAVNPVNLYGASKLCAEKLVVQGNAYSNREETLLCSVRYGNVMGTRGSVVPIFKRQRTSGTVTVTDPRMTRFWLSLEDGVGVVIKSLKIMRGGEVFVPKIPSIRITNLVEVIAPDCRIDTIGIRDGEKIHEMLISVDEARNALEFDDHYIIESSFNRWRSDPAVKAKPVADGFSYQSDTNARWLSVDELREMIEAAGD